jgi:hypothetical protein
VVVGTITFVNAQRVGLRKAVCRMIASPDLLGVAHRLLTIVMGVLRCGQPHAMSFSSACASDDLNAVA